MFAADNTQTSQMTINKVHPLLLQSKDTDNEPDAYFMWTADNSNCECSPILLILLHHCIPFGTNAILSYVQFVFFCQIKLGRCRLQSSDDSLKAHTPEKYHNALPSIVLARLKCL